MKLLVLDCETTGLLVPGAAQQPSLIEIAAQLYCTESDTVLATIQYILPGDGSNAAEGINHIPIAALEKVKEIPLVTEAARNTFKMGYTQSDYIVAHNAEFDRTFIQRDFPDLPVKPWICSFRDLTFPRQGRSQRLAHLAVDHDIPVIDAHRALGDVSLLVSLLKTFKRRGELAEKIEAVRNMRENGHYYIARGYTTKDTQTRLKDCGFKWDFRLKTFGKWCLPEEAKSITYVQLEAGP